MGPQREQAMFTHGPHGVLLLTDFSRACATQWLVQRGRRFTCNQAPRRDCGKAAPSGPRRDGTKTDRGVQLRARAAYAARADMAARDADLPLGRDHRSTILSIDRATLMRSVKRMPAPPDGKKTLQFRAHTARKLTDKRSVPLWQGWTASKPTMRLGGSAAIAAATSAAAVLGARSRSWLGRSARSKCAAQVRNANELHASKKPRTAAGSSLTARASTLRKGEKDEVLTVVSTTLDSMFIDVVNEPVTKDLCYWIRAIAQGKAIKCKDIVYRHKPSLHVSQKMVFTSVFCAKFPSTVYMCEMLAQLKGSKWIISRLEGKVESNLFVVGGKRDLVKLMLKLRRSKPNSS